MGKRSNFERVERDFYPTPYDAVVPLIPHLDEADDEYIEPCCGDGALIKHLATFGYNCFYASDVQPKLDWAAVNDVLTAPFNTHKTFITNPPWDRKILHLIIERLSSINDTWLLFDADWMHTRQAIPFLPRLRKVVSVGRVRWIPDSKMTGKDNCCWYHFTAVNDTPTVFVGRK